MININNNKKGFTLIELLMVTAIIGILSSLSYWMYRLYVIKTQITEGISLTQQAQQQIIDYQNNQGVWPQSNSDISLVSLSGKYVSSIELDGATQPPQIIITFGNQANLEITGKTVMITALTTSTGNVSWNCQSGTVDAIFLPSSCKANN